MNQEERALQYLATVNHASGIIDEIRSFVEASPACLSQMCEANHAMWSAINHDQSQDHLSWPPIVK